MCYNQLMVHYLRITDQLIHYPGRPARPRNGHLRVISIILWKQYSGRKFFGFFPGISDRFLQDPVAGIIELDEYAICQSLRQIEHNVEHMIQSVVKYLRMVPIY